MRAGFQGFDGLARVKVVRRGEHDHGRSRCNHGVKVTVDASRGMQFTDGIRHKFLIGLAPFDFEVAASAQKAGMPSADGADTDHDQSWFQRHMENPPSTTRLCPVM